MKTQYELHADAFTVAPSRKTPIAKAIPSVRASRASAPAPSKTAAKVKVNASSKALLATCAPVIAKVVKKVSAQKSVVVEAQPDFFIVTLAQSLQGVKNEIKAGLKAALPDEIKIGAWERARDLEDGDICYRVAYSI
jgi:hypothetical protein